MQLKSQWLKTRKNQLLAQLAECETQNQQIITTLTQESKLKDQEIIKLKKNLEQQQLNLKQQKAQTKTRIETLQSLVCSKDQALLILKNQNQKLTVSVQQKTNIINQNNAKIVQIQHSLATQIQTKSKNINELKAQIVSLQSKHQLQMQKLSKDYQQQMSKSQQELKKNYNQQLSTLKKNNLLILEKMQQQYKIITTAANQNKKDIQKDSNRYVAQNSKLLSTINQYKLSKLNLESNINTLEQQIKILQKQNQIFKDNSKRQIQFLRQQKTLLADKNKKLVDKNEQLTWNQRQNQIKKDEEIKRIRRQIDSSFKEIMIKAEEEAKQAQNYNKILKQQVIALQLKVRELSQNIQTQNAFFKSQQQKLGLVQTEKQKLIIEYKQGGSQNLLKSNQLLKNQLVRKNCQIQVYQQDIKRLKAKVNSVAKIHDELSKHKQIMQKQNKMLLSEIVFLRDKGKKGKNNLKGSQVSNSNFLGQMNSQQSGVFEDIQQYKKLIEFMTDQMNQVSKKIIQKDVLIEKLQAQIRRYQIQLS